ncbi:alanine/glycine:cation symporter family protein [Paucibacter sp. Y2R2-4]|uniref:alanine/glycine:cation symporter family protein n=1 Tax=Paucibacter sp. Y2R2-4 TaxID=2893553 RepID=UPI0021E419BD|nr:alanine/glycine:cation symporter family protein [Paucibacter sp. Y2R2-4]MCV2349098.1 alanine:cation symporter family protein [Paucibacter sp. Y2R2-4]
MPESCRQRRSSFVPVKGQSFQADPARPGCASLGRSAAFIALLGLGLPSWAHAQGFDQAVDHFFANTFGWFVDLIFYSVPIAGTQFPLIAGWLMLAALIFSVYFGFPQLFKAKLALDIVRGRYSNPKDREPGEVSHFQALTTALSGTVGLGNMAGVGVAVAIGGPGATFWMIIVGLLGMATKFTECTLGVKYRTVLPSGAISGGPMYYLRDGLAERGLPRLGKLLAAGFALMAVLGALGGGNMFQGNQANAMIVQTFDLPTGYGWVVGLILALLVFGVMLGGMPKIGAVTARLVPWMAFLYIGLTAAVLIVNFERIPQAFSSILEGAFRAEGVAGGVLGALIQGLKRATFSNEAGVGSSAIAHSAVKTKEPVTEGLVALLEPFIDTVVICTMTALVITIAGINMGPYPNPTGLSGIELTSAAFQETAAWFRYPLALAVVVFAVSTMISWGYYGLKAWTYLLGESRLSAAAFKLLFCSFVVVGASINFGAVINFSDAAIFAMSIFNLIGVYLLAPVVKAEYQQFLAKIESGQLKRYPKARPALSASA